MRPDVAPSQQRGRILPAAALLAPAMLVSTLLMVLPLGFILVYSFWTRSPSGAVVPVFTTANWQELFGDTYYLAVLIRTLLRAVLSTVASAILGYIVAYFLAFTRSRHRNALFLLLMLPFWVSYVVRTMSWVHVLGANGLVNTVLRTVGIAHAPIKLLYTDFSVLLGLMTVTLPYMILNIFVSLDTIDRNLVPAARSLGASAAAAFRDITLPLSLPGLGAGCLLCFLFSAGAYLAPMILGGPSDSMFANLIYEAVITQFDWPFGAVLALVMLLVLGGVSLIYSRLLGINQVMRSFAS